MLTQICPAAVSQAGKEGKAFILLNLTRETIIKLQICDYIIIGPGITPPVAVFYKDLQFLQREILIVSLFLFVI